MGVDRLGEGLGPEHEMWRNRRTDALMNKCYVAFTYLSSQTGLVRALEIRERLSSSERRAVQVLGYIGSVGQLSQGL